MDCYLFYARYPHWFSLAMAVKSHLEEQGSRAVIVIPGRFTGILRQLGLKDDEDFVAATELENKTQLFKDLDCRVILHHSGSGVEEYTRFFEAFFREINQKPRLCFYVDGYTNRYLDSKKIDDFLSGLPDQTLESVYYFDMDGRTETRWPEKHVTACRVQSRHLAAYAEAPIAKEVAAREFSKLRRATRTQDILLLILRPIGSQTFHRGAFAFDEGAVQAVDLYESLISKAAEKVGRKLTVFVRPDNRDAEYCEFLIDRIKKRVKDMPVESCGADWPDWMTFEPLLFAAQRELAPCRVHVATVDSTASLPFLQMRLTDSNFVGLPLDEAGNTPLGQEGLDFFRKKMRFLLGRVKHLGLLDIEIEEVSHNLYWIHNT
jgi:hypothetical protein